MEVEEQVAVLAKEIAAAHQAIDLFLISNEVAPNTPYSMPSAPLDRRIALLVGVVTSSVVGYVAAGVPTVAPLDVVKEEY